MISQQLSFKPYIAMQAAQQKLSIAGSLDKFAADLKDPEAAKLMQSREFADSMALARNLRVSAQDTSQFVEQMVRRGIKPSLAQKMTQILALNALANDPLAAAGLATCFEALGKDSQPLEKSSLNRQGELLLNPTLEKLSAHQGTTVEGFLAKEADQLCGTTPEAEAVMNVASVILTNSKEMDDLRSRALKLGLDGRETDILLSSMVIKAVSSEPAFRDNLSGLSSRALHLRMQSQGLNPGVSCLEPADES